MKTNSSPALIWSVAGSDNMAGAGIQADIKTSTYFNVHCCSIITAITAQNTQGVTASIPVSNTIFKQQLHTAAAEQLPTVIKSGLIASSDQAKGLAEFLATYPEIIYICDPVMISTSGDPLCDETTFRSIIDNLLPKADLITPNINEAAFLLGQNAGQFSHRYHSAEMLLDQYHCNSVLLKGGDHRHGLAIDYWVSNANKISLTSPKISLDHLPFHGTGCTLSTAIAANIASNHSLENALINAKQYINAAIEQSSLAGKGSHYLYHQPKINSFNHLPTVNIENLPNCQFAPLDAPIGFYPVVDSAARVKQLCQWGVRTIQLRIKTKDIDQLSNEIKQAIRIANAYQARLFINDHWQYAIQYGANGVHLGQQDLEIADLDRIKQAGLYLGISSHDYYELYRALKIHPSYIALGPIFHTDTKVMRFAPQGIDKLSLWRDLMPNNIQLVAIGGIKSQHMTDIYKHGANGIAVITYITKADNPELLTKKALIVAENHAKKM